MFGNDDVIYRHSIDVSAGKYSLVGRRTGGGWRARGGWRGGKGRGHSADTDLVDSVLSGSGVLSGRVNRESNSTDAWIDLRHNYYQLNMLKYSQLLVNQSLLLFINCTLLLLIN